MFSRPGFGGNVQSWFCVVSCMLCVPLVSVIISSRMFPVTCGDTARHAGTGALASRASTKCSKLARRGLMAERKSHHHEVLVSVPCASVGCEEEACSPSGNLVFQIRQFISTWRDKSPVLVYRCYLLSYSLGVSYSLYPPPKVSNSQALSN